MARRRESNIAEIVAQIAGLILLVGFLTPQGRQMLFGLGVILILVVFLALAGVFAFLLIRKSRQQAHAGTTFERATSAPVLLHTIKASNSAATMRSNSCAHLAFCSNRRGGLSGANPFISREAGSTRRLFRLPWNAGDGFAGELNRYFVGWGAEDCGSGGEDFGCGVKMLAKFGGGLSWLRQLQECLGSVPNIEFLVDIPQVGANSVCA